MVNPVYFYYPNMIGYVRVLLLFGAGYIVSSNPMMACLAYMTSMGLDAIDGTVARHFNQCSSSYFLFKPLFFFFLFCHLTVLICVLFFFCFSVDISVFLYDWYICVASAFGAQLDMLTDRMTTTCLYVVLATMYPDYWHYCAFFIMLDVTSHWMHMMSKWEAGNRSHKTARNDFLRWYYGFPYFMLTLCVGQELFLIKHFFPFNLAYGFVCVCVCMRVCLYVCDFVCITAVAQKKIES